MRYALIQTPIGPLTLDMRGTPFQMAAWLELQRIPYDQTRSYGDIARSIGLSLEQQTRTLFT